MEIKKNQIDDLNLELTLAVGKDDYADKRKKMLNDYRRKAEIKGFRKGMVPMSLVERIYGHSALVDAVNEVISESLSNYIQENSLRVLGEPLPAENQPENDWENGSDFNFVFDVALSPELSFELSDKDSLPYYKIKVEAEAKKDMKENMLKQFGNLENGEAVGDDDFIVADLEQGETKIEGTYVSLRNVAEEAKSLFVGKKPGDSFDVDVNIAFPNETDRASLLRVKKEELAELNPTYKITVKEVKTFKPAVPCQETYDRIFGEGNVKSEEEFDAKIEERLVAEYEQEAEGRYAKDVKDYLMKKADVKLPEQFLKRWLIAANEGKYTAEDIEKEFAGFLEDFKWQTIQEYLSNKYELKVDKDDLLNEAKSFASYQFAMYGLYDVPQDQLDSYAQRILEDKNQGSRVYEQVQFRKVIGAVKQHITIKDKDITVKKFREL